MKKKVTDLSQALAVGLPVPASAAGETFSDVPAPPWAVPAAPEWKNGGKAAPSAPYLVPPLRQCVFNQIAPRHSVPLVLSAEDTGKAVGLRYGLEFPGASVL